MNNWFERNATPSIIIYTLLVAAAVWAAFEFLFDENRVKSYEAELRKAESFNNSLNARLDHLDNENKKLRELLTSVPKTIPFYEKQIAELNEKLANAQESGESDTQTNSSSNSISSEANLYESHRKSGSSSAIIDQKTKLILGVPVINYGDTADIKITFPDGTKREIDDAKAGDTWEFMDEDKNYSLILEKIDWITQSFQSVVIEK